MLSGWNWKLLYSMELVCFSLDYNMHTILALAERV